MRKAVLLLVIALLVAACGDSGSSEPSVSPGNTDSSSAPAETPASVSTEGQDTATGETDAPEADPAETSSPAAEPSFDGPSAPDFELALADGSTFTLAGEQKPVYMVFWAEW